MEPRHAYPRIQFPRRPDCRRRFCWPVSRLRGLSVPTIESLDRRDLLRPIEERAVSREAPAGAHWLQQPRGPAGHFAGIQFFHEQVDRTQWLRRLPGPVSNVATDTASIGLANLRIGQRDILLIFMAARAAQ